MSALFTRRTVLITAATATGAALVSSHGLAQGTVHEVQMLNVHPENPGKVMVFYPQLLRIQPGDQVTFVLTDPAHNSQTTDGMLPDGAEGWIGQMNQEITVTLRQPGFYGYHCLPHHAMGMVGLIVVEGDGMFDNLDAARSVQHAGLAAQVWNEIWAEAEANGWLSA